MSGAPAAIAPVDSPQDDLSGRGRLRAWMGAVLIGWVVTTWASLALRAAVPPYPMFGSTVDDELQVRQSVAIAASNWLGDWSQATLSKGPGYPVFLALCHALGLNPMVGAQVIYLIGATLVGLGLYYWVRSRLLVAVLYLVLALNPAMLGGAASRVYRESLTAALATLVLGLALLLGALVAARLPTVVRLTALVATAVVLGLASAWLGQTRIDTAWTRVALVPLLVASLFWGAPGWRERGRRLALLVGASAVVAGMVLAVDAWVVRQSEVHFGVTITDDFARGSFADASKAWAGVQAGQPRSRVPISAAQREAVYRVSPAARELAPFLDGRKEFFGRSGSCQAAGICDDYAGGWMPWAMRIAAQSAGQVNSAAAMQEYFARIAADIRAACSDGSLDCGQPGLSPGVPPLGAIDRDLARANLTRLLRDGYLGFAPAALSGAYQATDDPETMAIWQQGVHSIPDLLGVQAQWIDPGTRIRVDRLRATYACLAGLLLWPAVLGVVWLLARAGRPRRAGLVAMSVLGAVLAHTLLLAAWSAGSGSPPGEGFYVMASIPYFLVGLVVGAWGVANGAVSAVRRRPAAPTPAA